MGRGKRRRKERQQEILNSTVRLDGVGEDPIVQDVLKKLGQVSEFEAMKISIAMQEQLTGEPIDPERKSKLMQRAADRDKNLAAYEEDREQFIEDAYEAGARNLGRLSGSQKDQVKARAAEKFKNAKVKARSDKALQNAKIRWAISNGPKEDIYVSPKMLQVKRGQGYEMVQENEVIQVMGFRFILKPGLNKNIPTYVANLYRQRQKQQEETKAREELMKGDFPTQSFVEEGREVVGLDKKWKELDESYNSPTDSASIGAGGKEVFTFGE